MTLPHGREGPEEPIHDRTAGLVVPARTRADYARHPASWLVSSLTTALIGLAAGLAGRDDVTALPAVPRRHDGRATVGAVPPPARGPGCNGPRSAPCSSPRPRRRFPSRPGREPVAALDAAHLRHAEPGRRRQPAGTCRTPWAMPPRAPPAATTAAAATWTAPPATCSPGTSAMLAERPGQAEPLRRRGATGPRRTAIRSRADRPQGAPTGPRSRSATSSRMGLKARKRGVQAGQHAGAPGREPPPF